MLKQLLLASCLLLLTACSATAPQWALTPVNDTQTHFITAGSGNTVSLAKADALEQLANRLIVNVQATALTNRSKSANNEVRQSFESKGRLISNAFNFVSADVIKNKNVNNQQFVLMKVDKESVFKDIDNFLSLNVAPLIDRAKQSNPMLIASGLLLWPQLKKIEQYLALLKNHGRPNERLESRLNDLKQSFSQLLSSSQLKITVGDNNASQRLNLLSALNKQYGSFTQPQANSTHKIDMIIMGPVIKQFEDAPLFSMKIEADQIITVDNKLVLKQPITIFEIGTSIEQVKSTAQMKFLSKLSLLSD